MHVARLTLILYLFFYYSGRKETTANAMQTNIIMPLCNELNHKLNPFNSAASHMRSVVSSASEFREVFPPQTAIFYLVCHSGVASVLSVGGDFYSIL